MKKLNFLMIKTFCRTSSLESVAFWARLAELSLDVWGEIISNESSPSFNPIHASSIFDYSQNYSLKLTLLMFSVFLETSAIHKKKHFTIRVFSKIWSWFFLLFLFYLHNYLFTFKKSCQLFLRIFHCCIWCKLLWVTKFW